MELAAQVTSRDGASAAAAGLIGGKADVVVAMADLNGAGAMREACARKASVVAERTTRHLW